MNLETNVQKDLKIPDCSSIHSVEDKVLIQSWGSESYRYTYKLFKLSEEGELQLLEEKSSLEVFNGYGISLLYLGLGNLEILFSENRFLNFSSGKLVFSRFDYED